MAAGKTKNEKEWDKFWNELAVNCWGKRANPSYPAAQIRKIMNRYLIKQKPIIKK
jgi:hypothetical protein